MVILVTGAGGFIGSHLCAELEGELSFVCAASNCRWFRSHSVTRDTSGSIIALYAAAGPIRPLPKIKTFILQTS